MRKRFLWAAALAVVAAVCFACARTQTQAPKSDPSPIAVTGALGSAFVKSNASQEMVARIAVTASPRTTSARPPVNLVLLVDTSGSMEGRAIADARAASLALLDTLSPRDRLAVVTFDSKAEVLLPSTKLEDADTKELRAKIGAMKARGTTDMASGLRLALNEVEKSLEKDGVNRIVLLGDGVPNDDAQIASLVAEATLRGVSITTMGLGTDYDETLMGRIAQQSGGKFSYVEDSTKVASFFEEEVVRLHRVVARTAVLELRPGPGVTIKNVVGRQIVAIDNHAVSVTLGDLTYGEENEIVVELASSPTKDGGAIEALDAILRWQDGYGGTAREERFFLGAKATNDEARIAASKDQSVADAVARAKDAAATLQKIEQQRNLDRAKSGNLPAAPVVGIPMPAPKQSADETRRAHDQAMRNFQAH